MKMELYKLPDAQKNNIAETIPLLGILSV